MKKNASFPHSPSQIQASILHFLRRFSKTIFSKCSCPKFARDIFGAKSVIPDRKKSPQKSGSHVSLPPRKVTMGLGTIPQFDEELGLNWLEWLGFRVRSEILAHLKREPWSPKSVFLLFFRDRPILEGPPITSGEFSGRWARYFWHIFAHFFRFLCRFGNWHFETVRKMPIISLFAMYFSFDPYECDLINEELLS